MTPVLVDSSILLDIVTDDPRWAEASAAALERCANDATLIINSVIYSEVSIGFTRIEQLEDALPAAWIHREGIPWEAAFLAGKQFVRYRRRGGSRRSPLPDFFIGAHAAVRKYRLLTRDPRRFRSYFPSVTIVSS